jgi:hypothetical protein
VVYGLQAKEISEKFQNKLICCLFLSKIKEKYFLMANHCFEVEKEPLKSQASGG